VVALLALVDQGVVLPAGAAVGRAQRSDAALVAGLSRRLGPDASVLQLPVVSFPDDPGAERLLAPAVQDADGLRFSAGFFRGGRGDWQTSWSAQPAGRLARGAAAAGYDALLLQRTHHLVPSDGSWERELGSTLGAPTVRSDDGAFVWWDLRPLRADLVAAHGSTAVRRAGELVTRPVGVSFEGTTELRTSGRVMGKGGAVVLRRLDDDRRPVRLHLVVSAPPGARVRVGGDRNIRVVGPDGRVDASVQVDLRPREVVVPVERVDGGGTEVKVSDVTVEDVRALDDPVLGAAGTSGG
jgi:hypothetical protein